MSKLALLTSLVNLLAVMKTNPDGSRTIDAQHEWIIENAKALVRSGIRGEQS